MKDRLKTIRDRIKNAAVSCGRAQESVRLVAVSKTMTAERIKEAIDAGADILGENYIQEARDKISVLSSYHVSWHFIGHLQTNKAKYAVKLFDLIHTVDSVKLARELDKEAGKINKIQEILVQVNIGDEATKAGVSEQDLPQLIKEIAAFKNLCLKGLMIIPPFFDEPEKVRPYFKALCSLRNNICTENPNVSLPELSMGMTGDFEVAIAEGATLVRIGTAIFGKRG